jgi:hypothetical protein
VALIALPFDASSQKRRKGFVLNLGLGPAATRYSFTDRNFAGSAETKIGVGTDLKIGHAASDQLLIYYSNDASFFSPADEYLVSSGLSGVGVTYFLMPQAPSYYVDGAIGIAAWNVLSQADATLDSMTGFGLAVGAGYEFARHWLVDVDIVVGRPRGDFSAGYNTTTIRLGLIWLAY